MNLVQKSRRHRVRNRLNIPWKVTDDGDVVHFWNMNDAVYAAGLISSAPRSVGDKDLDQGTAANKPLITGLSLRENRVLYSSTLDNAYWPSFNSSLVPVVGAWPEGSGYYKLTEDASVGVTHDTRKALTSVISGETLTQSCYAKAGERTKIRFRKSGGAAKHAYIDLTDGSVNNNTYDTAPVVTDAGNGWWKIEVSFTVDAASHNLLYIFLVEGSGTTTTYNGDGTSGCYLQGFSLRSSSSSSDYQVTTTAPIWSCRNPGHLRGAIFSSHDAGGDDFLQTLDFAIAISQPALVFKAFQILVDDGAGDAFFSDGRDVTDRILTGFESGLTGIGHSATTWVGDDTTYVINTNYAYSDYFSGASSWQKRDNGSLITNSPGTDGIAGLTVGADYLGANNSQILLYELGIYTGSDPVGFSTKYYNYCRRIGLCP